MHPDATPNLSRDEAVSYPAQSNEQSNNYDGDENSPTHEPMDRASDGARRIGETAGEMGRDAKNQLRDTSSKIGQSARDLGATAQDKATDAMHSVNRQLYKAREAVHGGTASAKQRFNEAVHDEPNLGEGWRVIGESKQRENAYEVEQTSTGKRFLVVTDVANDTKTTTFYDAQGKQKIREMKQKI